MIFVLSEFVQFVYQLFKRSSKFVGFIGLGIIAYLMGTASPITTSDYAVYQQMYNNPAMFGNYFERGYSLLSRWFFSHGWMYSSFRVFFSFAAAFILYVGVKRFTNNIALFSFIYGITIFFIDATQIRNFMMISIVTFGLSFLINDGYLNYMLATICIIIAGQFQSIGFVFLLTVVLSFFFRNLLKKSPKSLLVVSLVFTILLLLVVAVIGYSGLNDILVKVAGNLGNRTNLATKISGQYVGGSSTRYLIMVVTSTVVGFLFVHRLLLIALQAKQKVNEISVLWFGVVTTFFCLPVLIFAIDYSRIQRAGFVFVLVGVAMLYEQYHSFTRNTNLSLKLLAIIVCVMYGITHNIVWGSAFLQTIPYLARLVA